MYITCLDLEGVLVPEIWIAFAKETGIPELEKTTRDEPDYDKLMKYRIGILKEHGLGLKEIQDVIAKIDAIPELDKITLDDIRPSSRKYPFIQFKAEHVRAGHVDIYGKGGKVRRVYFPKSLREDALAWLGETGRASGFLWTGRSGERLTQRGIAQQLKDYARRFKIPEAVVYPHSFRHRFAKNFLERFNDITLLADLMGHESIETTRIYLRRTAEEQREVVDRVITW